MSITHLVRGKSETDWRWSDTGKSARIGRNIGEPVSFYIVEQKLDGDKQYIAVQYVTARR